jgi:hypothetical protein
MTCTTELIKLVREAIAAAAVLTAAHNVAEVLADVGKELAVLVRDELALDAVVAVTK